MCVRLYLYIIHNKLVSVQMMDRIQERIPPHLKPW